VIAFVIFINPIAADPDPDPFRMMEENVAMSIFPINNTRSDTPVVCCNAFFGPKFLRIVPYQYNKQNVVGVTHPIAKG